jgi:putative flippase GtrA
VVTFEGVYRGFLRLVRFSIVGVLNTLASYLVFAAFIRMGFHFSVATFAAFTVGMLMGFKLHGAYVFDHPGDRRFLRFSMISLAIFAFSLLIQTLVRDTVNDYVAGAIAAVITIPISFLLNRAFVFHAPDASEQDQHDGR